MKELSPEMIRQGLKTSFIGQRIQYFPEVASTMDLAREQARGGAAEGTVVVAGQQTAGRGRRERGWHSPPGNIALSLVLRPSLGDLSKMVMFASLAVVDAIRRVAGVEADIKWPNDILINGKKVCGILMTSEVRSGAVDHVVIGLGLNVNMDVAAYPGIAAIATSLSAETGIEFDPVMVMQALLEELERYYLMIDGEALFTEWRGRLITLGKQVSATWGEYCYEGIAEDVSPDGSLTLRQADGGIVRIVAGDVTLR